ncbi:MAG: prsA3, partial [Proteobacteria bacterium]|nr:prsA3 [Pseudomonadota bacterium]
EARRPQADFAALAKQHSQHDSAKRGGDLGYVTRGQLPPPLEQTAFALKEGEVSGIVETELGCHILKLEKRRSGLIPEAEARETARAFLKGEKAQSVLRKHIETLRRKARIEILLRG